jgi:hypothetical protein
MQPGYSWPPFPDHIKLEFTSISRRVTLNLVRIGYFHTLAGSYPPVTPAEPFKDLTLNHSIKLETLLAAKLDHSGLIEGLLEKELR